MRFIVLLLWTTAALRAQTISYDAMVQGAVDFEIQPLLNLLEHKQQQRIAAWTYWTGNIGQHRIVVARTEMGPLNAAASTALGINNFHPRFVINQGTAGAHTPELNVFDIVLGEKTVDYGAVQSDHADTGAGIHVEAWKAMGTELRLQPDHITHFPFFSGNTALLALAQKTKYGRGKLVTGTVGSAYQFNRQLDYIRWVHNTFGTDAEDMESAFAAGVAQGMNVPFLAVRIISDSEFNHPNLEKVAGQYCAEFVAQVLDRLP